MNINTWAQKIHKQNVKVGWWDEPVCATTKLQLVSTEICEATEGERKDLMDDKLPHRKMGEVELADALIRMLDYGAWKGLHHVGLVISTKVHPSWTIGRNHFALTTLLVEFAKDENHQTYTALLNAILILGNVLGYNVVSAAVEKIEYNKKRPDHKRENRNTKHGKAF